MKLFTIAATIYAFAMSLSWSQGQKVAHVEPSGIRQHLVWDNASANQWEHAYPVGNGRLGAMPFGGYPNERIILNEETIWQGRKNASNDYDAMFLVDEIRKLLFAGGFSKAHKKINSELLIPHASREFQLMCDLRLAYAPEDKDITYKNYKRYLSMNEAVAVTELETANGNVIKQQVFSSHPDDLIVVRLESKNANGLSVDVNIDRINHYETEAIDENTLLINGQAMKDEKDKGVCWHAAARVLADGGTVKRKNKAIQIRKATNVTILIAASTDYNPRQPFIPLRHDRAKACLETIAKVQTTSFAKLKQPHVQDHERLFNRATLDLGETPPEVLKMKTADRLKAFNSGSPDPDLIEDFFQMGRYLLIASSRKGTLPPSITGIWNANPNSHRSYDWHTNINVQENYWHAEVTNLSELHEPFITLLDDISKGQGKTMAEKLGCRGFLITHETSIWKDVHLSGSSWWGMWPMGGAWCCSHVMEHYRFTQDREFLSKTAYPILKANVEFCLDWLVVNPDTGKLVSGPSSSPENGFYVGDDKQVYNSCMGPTVDHMIIRESFTDFIETVETLGIDDPLTKEVRTALKNLTGTQIGKDGRIMEWDKEYKEWKVNHRHYSHLYGLYPGAQISPDKTPELFAAARKSIEARQVNGGVNHGWSRAHLLNLYARLLDGENAYATIQYLMKNNTLPNLMHTQQPIFFDGNGAGTAGIAEMLLQSQGKDGIIQFLPALPNIWPTGSFHGLCARGAFEIALKWDDHKPVEATVLSKAGNQFRFKRKGAAEVSCDSKTVEVAFEKKSGYYYFNTEKNCRYVIEFL